MLESFQGAVLQLLRVPPSPESPAGSPESTKVFHAGRNFYTWSLIRWGGVQAVAALGVVLAIAFFSQLMRNQAWPRWVWPLYIVLEAAGAAGFLAQLPVTFLALRIGYQMRWYIVTDRSLRIRSGVWAVEELTMTFANIQQITIRQGPLQQVLGIADVEVTSAGGGGGKKPGEKSRDGHAGYFEGVEDAKGIRDLILERLRRYRDSGIGDPDDAPTALAAAKEVLEETRQLRSALTTPLH